MEEDQRPWGGFTVLATGNRYKVKTLTVNSGSRTSLQSHRYRKEHWTVVAGKATVTLGSRTLTLYEGQSIEVAYGQKHRIANEEDMPLVIAEVQVGSYCGEDDITRYADDFGRTAP